MSSVDEKEYFWKRHFGSDYLIGSWCFIISTVPYVIIIALEYVWSIENGDSESAQISLLLSLIGAALYLIGSFLFLYLSYPENWQKIMKDVMEADLDKLSFIERYFTFNWLLIAVWLFFIPSFFYFVYPIWAYSDGTMGLGEFFLLLLGVTFILLITWFWVYASFPDSMRQNDFQGSSVFFDSVCLCDICCDKRQFMKKHLGTDFLVGSYAFCLLALIVTLFGFYLIAIYPSSYFCWLLFLSGIFFLIGFMVLTAASYPESFAQNDFQGSSYVYDFFASYGVVKEFKKSGNVGQGLDLESPVVPTETTALLQTEKVAVTQTELVLPDDDTIGNSSSGNVAPPAPTQRAVMVNCTC